MSTEDALQLDSNDGPFRPRALSEAFFHMLENECASLHPLLNYVMCDHTLMTGCEGHTSTSIIGAAA
ncbi:hypothetical protein [Paraburkholderia nodosa]|uniref:hypothetical protein n=1 Tax=Paraburkholderia nodosa TaxID=392320 RepID=UPI00048125C8|nr:hypothetical protein [Paraburkholderia nodosa]